ncbi:MAG: hypothetical protein WEB00_12235 [Dehalococcoidia bacterium]
MIGLLLRLYPRAWRDRYGEEVAAIMEDSDRRALDHLDLALGAVIARMEENMVVAKWSALVLWSVALLGLGFAIADLRDGYREVPNHWWSAAPLALALVVAAGYLSARWLDSRLEGE